jgi:hypothetical protein
MKWYNLFFIIILSCNVCPSMQSYEPDKQTVHLVQPTGEPSSWLKQLRLVGPSRRLYLVADVSSHGIGVLPAFVRELVADSELTHVR